MTLTDHSREHVHYYSTRTSTQWRRAMDARHCPYCQTWHIAYGQGYGAGKAAAYLAVDREQEAECILCQHLPCTCDDEYDTWKDMQLDAGDV